MSNKGMKEEINDNFTKIHISDRDIEPVLLIYAPQIDYIKPGKLLNIMNIPTTEYSQEPDSRTNMQLYIDDILANYHNRNIAHLSIIQDRIDKLGGSYNNGKLEFGANTIEGSLQIAIELLELINSNLNDLLGLVSVNNFLVSMMVGTEVTEVIGSPKTAGVSGDYVTTDEVKDMIKTETKPSVIADTFGIAGAWSGGGMLAEAIGVAPLPLKIGAAALYMLDRMGVIDSLLEKMDGSAGYKPGYGTSSYFYPYTTSTFIGNLEKMDGSGGYSPGSNRIEWYYYAPPTYTGNKETKQSTGKYETNNLRSILTQEPKGMLKEVLSGYTDDELEAIILKNKDVTIRAKEPTSKRSGSKYKEPENFFEKFFSTFEYELGAAELPHEMKNQYATNQPNNTYANTTSKNASISADLKESTNYGPQQIEHTYEMPITSTITINSTEKVDYEDLLRRLKREIQNEILGIKAVLL